MIKRILALLLAFVMASSVVWAEEVVQPDEEIQDEVIETEEKTLKNFENFKVFSSC